jgi:AcrR family transcriptional regulator
VVDQDPLPLLPDRLQLPRGRAALPGPEVSTSQRGRILQAIVEEVAARGYAATRVQDVTSRARVSRSAFYGAFADKQDAFAQAHLAASLQLLDRIAAAVKALPADAGWRAGHRAGVREYLGALVASPAYATSFMVEVRSAGSRLLDQRDRVLERHAKRLSGLAAAAIREHETSRLPSSLAMIGAVGAADELATREIRAGRVADLLELTDPIIEVQLALILGGQDSAT